MCFRNVECVYVCVRESGKRSFLCASNSCGRIFSGRSPVRFSWTRFILDFLTFRSGNKLIISVKVKLRVTLLTAEIFCERTAESKPSCLLRDSYFLFVIIIEFLYQICPGCDPASGPVTPGTGSSKTFCGTECRRTWGEFLHRHERDARWWTKLWQIGKGRGDASSV